MNFVDFDNFVSIISFQIEGIIINYHPSLIAFGEITFGKDGIKHRTSESRASIRSSKKKRRACLQAKSCVGQSINRFSRRCRLLREKFL